MNIIARRAILFYIERYPDSETALMTWYHEFSKQNFDSFNQLKSNYRKASIISNHRVIFNINGNSYRLIVSVNIKQSAAYIIWFGTHQEYDKIDATNIEFDIRILNYKSN